MNKWGLVVVLALLCGCTMGLYSGSSPVTQLTNKDFDKVYKGIWLVEFYAPWCGHCQRLAPEYEKAAKALKGIAKIAAVNQDSEKVSVSVQGFPTIKFFVDGKMSDYTGERTAKAIIDFVLNQYKKVAYERIGSRDTGSSGGSGSGATNDKDVVVLDDGNFDDSVLRDDSPWFVEFYAPWCGHCQRLAPEWALLATNLKGEVKVAKVDATENKELAGRFGVQGYPTIKFFPSGPKDDSSALDYDGQRSESEMAEWAREKTAGSKHFQHIHLNSQKVYEEYCKERNLCIVSFLPHKLDSTPEEREKYLESIKETALNFRGKPFKFIWAQGGDHFEVEEKLGISGVGYPSVVAIFNSKNVFGRMKRAFSQENLQQFATQILNNKAKFVKLGELPAFKTVAAEEASNSQGGCGEHLCTEPPNEQQYPEQL